ncbi:5-oxoprolinase subunit B family protein [Frigidibacter sp. MR17.24]|uniref:5-oxoprolinase subunit B family protein n=1 Tax=Frigidibacter sp. MR17.24 TaxID=3127345 RepID=UPI003012FA55
MSGYPRFKPVADRAVLVEFGERIDAAVNARVIAFDRALAARPFAGFAEATPAYVNLLVEFDPAVTDHATATAALAGLLDGLDAAATEGRLREVEVCYDDDLAPDMAAVCSATGLSRDAVIAAHLAGDYRVHMYGFAPGYAYLAGLPAALQLPRKAQPVRDIRAGAVMIAGPQCLVSTLTMPTGWWMIGRSATRILDPGAERPFLFDVGDRVAFRRVDRARYDAGLAREGREA